MKRLIYFLVCISAVLYLLTSCDSSKSITQNYGLSNFSTEVNIVNGIVQKETFDAENIVPTKKDLIKNLEAHSYTIETSTTFPGTDIIVDRVYATKNGKIIDICYGLTEADAIFLFSLYENEYTNFYILAQNTNFVYCISDKTTFKNAGFTSLANDGIQYIYE